MRILIVTPRVPWPSTDGGRLAMARLAEALARCDADVRILSLNPRKHRVHALSSPLPLTAVDTNTSAMLRPALRAITTDVPYVVTRFFSSEFANALRTAIRRFNPQIVQIESPFMLPYAAIVRQESRARIVLRSLNVECRIWEGLASVATNHLHRMLLTHVASSLRQYEAQQMAHVDAIVPISESDADDFRRLAPVVPPMHVVPCGAIIRSVDAAASEPLSAGFIGSLDFRPNRQAAEWLLEHLWPRVLERLPEATLSIAGSAAPDSLRRRAQRLGVTLLPNVADADAFVASNAVIVAPLFAGGGMRIKVLEAMALGKPVVATSIGAGGIDVRNGENIIIADDVSSFADAVVTLLQDTKFAARVGESARHTVATRYDPDVLARGLKSFYESLIS